MQFHSSPKTFAYRKGHLLGWILMVWYFPSLLHYCSFEAVCLLLNKLPFNHYVIHSVTNDPIRANRILKMLLRRTKTTTCECVRRLKVDHLSYLTVCRQIKGISCVESYRQLGFLKIDLYIVLC